jgi:hypothetical protein
MKAAKRGKQLVRMRMWRFCGNVKNARYLIGLQVPKASIIALR